MKVLDKIYWGYGQDPVKFFDFQRFSAEGAEYALAIGFVNFKCLAGLTNEKVVHMTFEEPNGFVTPKMFLCHEWLHIIDRVLTICPYTADWSNTKFPDNKWVLGFFPFNEELIPPPTEKEFDVIYAGRTTPETPEIVKASAPFKHCFVYYKPEPHVTHVKVPYLQKLDLYAKSKVAVVHNLLFPNSETASGLRKNQPEAVRDNRAFAQIADASNSQPIVPQVKSRLIEAAFCRSLILCRRDPWNLVETYFEPDKEFVYYEAGKLEQTLKKVLSDYDSYLPVIEAAYNKAINSYTTRHYFDKYLKEPWK